MPVTTRRHWTAADVRELIQEDRHWPRYELLDGELLVTPAPAPAHQVIIGAVFRTVAEYCAGQQVGIPLMSPADIELAPESIMQPDVFVVPEELMPGEPPKDWKSITWLLLAVEVLSPSTHRQDRVRKREFYLDHGVREYWIVDGDARVIEQWSPQSTRPTLCRDTLVWQPHGAHAPLRVDVEEFFVRDCRLPRRL